jgi:hypothetical protein
MNRALTFEQLMALPAKERRAAMTAQLRAEVEPASAEEIDQAQFELLPRGLDQLPAHQLKEFAETGRDDLPFYLRD